MGRIIYIPVIIVSIVFYCLQAERDRHEVSQCCVCVYGIMYRRHVIGMMLCRVTYLSSNKCIVSLFTV